MTGFRPTGAPSGAAIGRAPGVRPAARADSALGCVRFRRGQGSAGRHFPFRILSGVRGWGANRSWAGAPRDSGVCAGAIAAGRENALGGHAFEPGDMRSWETFGPAGRARVAKGGLAPLDCGPYALFFFIVFPPIGRAVAPLVRPRGGETNKKTGGWFSIQGWRATPGNTRAPQGGETRLVQGARTYFTRSAFVITTASTGTSWCPALLPVLTFRMASTVSRPVRTLPKTA